MAAKKPVKKQTAKQSKDNVTGLLIGSLVLLVLILGSIGGYYFYQEKMKASNGPRPEFFKVGKVQAHLAGKRLVQTEINLEVKDPAVGTVLQQRKPEIRSTIEASFAAANEDTIHTVEGKIAVQKDIRKGLNQMLGQRGVKEVLFSNFTLE